MASKKEQRRASRANRRTAREQRRRSAPTKDDPPFPAELEDFLEHHCYWPHVDDRTPAAGLNPIQRDYLRRRTCFRLDARGRRQYGADIIAKSRRVWMTSLALGCIAHQLIQTPGLRAITVLQTEVRDVGPELRRQMSFAFKHFPASWCGSYKWRSGVLLLDNGSRWTCVTAGHSETIADSSLASGGVDILHLSEAAKYRHASVLFAVAINAVPRTTGSIICESTFPPHRIAWFADQYHLTRSGVGRFLRAFFWPWHADPRKQIPSDDLEYEQVTSAEFVAVMEHDDLQAELVLGLTAGQRAWRRANYCRGSAADRRRARVENPEDDSSIFVALHEPWLDEGALKQLDAATRKPAHRARLSENVVGETWREADEPIVIAVDVSQFRGRDNKAAIALTTKTLELVGCVHGKSLESEFADSIVWLIERLGFGSVRARGYIVAVERNRDFGLIDELRSRSVRLYFEAGRNKPGFLTTARNRPILLDRILAAIEGPDEHDDGTPRKLGPIRVMPSAELARELRGLQEINGKIEAGEGYKDDLAIAYAIALYLAPLSKMRRGTTALPASVAAGDVRPDYAAQLAALDRGGGPS